jgi:hypothetical protein
MLNSLVVAVLEVVIAVFIAHPVPMLEQLVVGGRVL